jgi:putative phosphoesterase
MRIGVISDTHGVIRPEALAVLAGSDLILHAGDVGAPDVLAALRRIAPVVAVRGNNDAGPWASRLAVTKTVRAAGERLYLLHDLKELDVDPVAGGFRAVVSGHSHRAKAETRDGVVYLNPGSAGPRRFRLPVTVAHLRLDGSTASAEIVELEPLAPPRRSSRPAAGRRIP